MSINQITIYTVAKDDSVQIDVPSFPYKMTLNLPFDIQELDNGNVYIRDEGQPYDKRFVELDFILTSSQQNALNQFLAYTHRGEAFILTLSTGSGFFPFGPDLGDGGDFPVAIEIVGTPQAKYNPFRYLTCKLRMTLIGTPPVYSLPTQITDGTLSIAGVGSMNLPPDLFDPNQEYKYDTQFTENSTPEIISRGQKGDCVHSVFTLLSNQSKAAALLNAITTLFRKMPMTINSTDYTFIFGIDQPEAGLSAQLISNVIEVTHENFNRFSFKLEYHKV